MSTNPKRLNGDAKILFDHLNQQREDDKSEDKIKWVEHNDSARDFRNEIKADISEVWRAMREGFDKLTDAIINQPRNNGVDIKTVIGISMFLLTIITFIGISLGTSLVTLKTEIAGSNDNIEKRFVERHIEQGQTIKELDRKLQREITLIRESDGIIFDTMMAEILRIREWKDSVERGQGKMDASQSSKIDNLKELLEVKASDRFTGAEGKMMQRQVDRLEERLTFLTKEQMMRQGEKNRIE